MVYVECGLFGRFSWYVEWSTCIRWYDTYLFFFFNSTVKQPQPVHLCKTSWNLQGGPKMVHVSYYIHLGIFSSSGVWGVVCILSKLQNISSNRNYYSMYIDPCHSNLHSRIGRRCLWTTITSTSTSTTRLPPCMPSKPYHLWRKAEKFQSTIYTP